MKEQAIVVIGIMLHQCPKGKLQLVRERVIVVKGVMIPQSILQIIHLDRIRIGKKYIRWTGSSSVLNAFASIIKHAKKKDGRELIGSERAEDFGMVGRKRDRDSRDSQSGEGLE